MTGIGLRKRLITGTAAVFALIGSATLPAQADGDHTKHETSHETSAMAAGIMTMDAFSPASAPGINTASAYLTIENTGGSPADLVGVASPAFNMAHLHKTSMSNGVMTMDPVAQLAIPSGGKVMFEPGGLHIMLMGAKAPLKPGDTFPLVLSFASGAKLEVTVTVTKPGEMPAMSHDHSSMKMN